jgi:pimeloyl-ACP methyl ester carboxylesterase
VTWGVAIPGLAMAASELPVIDGLICLDNPDTGSGARLSSAYTLEDVAELHLKAINCIRFVTSQPTIIGMSMGGMIAIVLASKLRRHLPPTCRFRLLVTSANSQDLPAVPDALLADWRTVRPGVVDDFGRILEPFFSPQFISAHPATVADYFRYRAAGRNGQSPRDFMRQLAALRSFDGAQHLRNADPAELEFIGGGADRILGPAHNLRLRDLVAAAVHHELSDLGHMANYEKPTLFHSTWESYVNS